MESFFTDTLGLSDTTYRYIFLPFLIFLARITDVSINTVRIIYVLGGRKVMAAFLGFFESLIWLMAIQQIFEHLDNWASYVAYPLGFATGIFVGMLIEERIAYGKVIVRIITRKDISVLKDYLEQRMIRYTVTGSVGKDGEESIVFTVLERENLGELLEFIKEQIPESFYTVGRVHQAADGAAILKETSRWSISSWLKGVRRS